MQLAGWLSKTTVPVLLGVFPAWAGTWFSLFPTAETLAGQFIAAAVVVGSYMTANAARDSSQCEQAAWEGTMGESHHTTANLGLWTFGQMELTCSTMA